MIPGLADSVQLAADGFAVTGLWVTAIQDGMTAVQELVVGWFLGSNLFFQNLKAIGRYSVMHISIGLRSQTG